MHNYSIGLRHPSPQSFPANPQVCPTLIRTFSHRSFSLNHTDAYDLCQRGTARARFTAPEAGVLPRARSPFPGLARGRRYRFPSPAFLG